MRKLLPDPANRLDPKMRVQWWIQGAITTAVVALVVGIGTYAARRAGVLAPQVAGGTVVGLVALLAGVQPPVAYRRHRYEIRDVDLFVSSGFIFAKHVLVPFDRIQYVENKQGPLDRLFGLTQLHVYTAAGSAVKIPGLPVEEADGLRNHLSRVAGSLAV